MGSHTTQWRMENYISSSQEYLSKGFILLIADILSLLTIASCVFIKIPQIKIILQSKSSHGQVFLLKYLFKYNNNVYYYKFLGISTYGLALELFSYTVMTSYNYRRNYDYLSYMEYPILLMQEYVLIFVVFKYQNLLGANIRKAAAAAYATIVLLVYIKIFPMFILIMLVVSRF